MLIALDAEVLEDNRVDFELASRASYGIINNISEGGCVCRDTYQFTGKYPALLYICIKGQNALCANRTLTAEVGGGVREDSGVKFRRNKYPYVCN